MSGKRLSAELRSRLEQRQKELYQQYIDMVVSGTRAAGLAEQQKVSRQLSDLKRSEAGWEWVFDWKAAHKVLCWMQANLKFPSGEVHGKALKLEPWQVFDIATLFGWVSISNRRLRRFTTGYWQISRKNGKSTTGGGVADYLAFGDDYPDARVYIAASSLDQCGESFLAASNMLTLGWYQGKVVVSDTKNNKQIDLGKAFVKGISSNPKDGKLPHGLLLDEYHQHPDKQLYNSIDSGRVADPTAMMLIITTAGVEIGGVCHQEYEKCKQIIAGIETSDRYWISIYEPDEEDREDEETTWEKANPNIGVSVDIPTMRDRYQKCSLAESDLIDFRIKNLNRWVMGSTRWANMEIWTTQCCDRFDVEALKGRTCYGGLDLSSSSDFTAFVLTFAPVSPGEKWKQLYMFWIPGNRVVALSRQLRKPLADWIAKGYVVATPGEVVDYSAVGAYIKQCMTLYDMPLIACDDWRLEQFVDKVGPWFEAIAAKYGQGPKSFSLPVDQFKEHYLQGLVTCGGNPVQTWMMDCVVSKTDSSGNVKLIKPSIDRGKSRVDGVIAAIMSFSTAKTHSTDVQLDPKNDLIFF